jgi:hypothetical protein
METWTWRHGHGDTDLETGNFKNIKRKTEAQAIFLLPFAHHANGSLSFFRLLKKQMDVIRL